MFDCLRDPTLYPDANTWARAYVRLWENREDDEDMGDVVRGANAIMLEGVHREAWGQWLDAQRTDHGATFAWRPLAGFPADRYVTIAINDKTTAMLFKQAFVGV